MGNLFEDAEKARHQRPMKLWEGAVGCGGAGATAMLWIENEILFYDQKPFKHIAIAGAVCAGIGALAVAVLRPTTYSDKIVADSTRPSVEPQR